MKTPGTGFISAGLLLFTFQTIAATHYVAQNSSNPVSPFTNWATAAYDIQDAVDASAAGDMVVVSNGIYAWGGRAMSGQLTNRVAVTLPITVESVNGPAVTLIQGSQAPPLPNGQYPARCVYLTSGACLEGFTLVGGGTEPELFGFEPASDLVAGGAWCASASAVITNCVISSNWAYAGVGGVYGGTLYNCTLTGNSGTTGGGAYDSVLQGCLLTGNQASTDGGGACKSILANCTVAENVGGGTYDCTNYNSIVYSNSTADDTGSTFSFCCTPQVEAGAGNITNNPLFVAPLNGSFRLQPNSPCINAGNNAFVVGATDLDGNPRISGGTVDMGAYEYQNPASIISYAWLEQYGLATDGSADYADTDGNGMNNWQKWVAGLDPTNPASVLQALSPAPSGTNIVVTWQSAANINYFVQRSAGPVPGSFQTIASGIPGQSGTTSYTDTNAPPPGPWFYRVGVP